MKISKKLAFLVPATCIVFLAGCNKSEATPTTFKDPFAYCKAVGTIDKIDDRYNGDKVPKEVIQGLKIEAVPTEMQERGTFWRCMNQKIYACFVGANIPCASKADINKTPAEGAIDYCKTNKNAYYIPNSIVGHETIYDWSCKKGKPKITKQNTDVDQEGYAVNYWQEIKSSE